MTNETQQRAPVDAPPRARATRRRSGVIATLFVVLGCATPHTSGDAPSVAVIVHPSNHIDSLGIHQLRRIFSKRERTWPASSGLDRKRIIPLDLGTQDPAREAFSRAVFDGSTDSVRRLWIAEGLKNGNEPPLERPPSKVLELVSRVPNAIGYVPAHMATKGVKIVSTF